MGDKTEQGNNLEPSPFVQKTSNGKIWIILGVFVIIIVLAFFLFFYHPPTNIVKCTESWSCGSWSACANNVQRRSCTDANNCGVTTNKPSILQRCTLNTVTCTSFTYSTWNDCSSGTQTRTVLTSSPNGCTGGSPILSQNCNVTIQSCSDKGLYLMTLGSNEICNGNMTVTVINSETQVCCSVPVITPVGISGQLISIWNSISNSGNCSNTEYISKLGSCSPYKCGYVSPLIEGNFTKGVIGRYSEKCSSLDELPNNGEQYCQYNDTELLSMTNYLTFMFEQCGPTGLECEIIMNETGYYLNGIPTENVLQDMYNSGDCSATFG